MPVINGEPPLLETDHLVSGSLGHGPAAWPLGRMLVVVFAICLMAWLAIIAYLVGF